MGRQRLVSGIEEERPHKSLTRPEVTFADTFTCCSAACFSPGNVCLLAQQAEVKDKMCVDVCKLDQKDALAGTLMWDVVQRL